MREKSCFSIILRKLTLLTSLLQCSLAIETLLTLTAEKEDAPAMIYPSFAGRVWDTQRMGTDTNMLLNAGFGSSSADRLVNFPVLQKRPNVKLIPRIGRKKRSVKDESMSESEDKSGKYFDQVKPDELLLNPDAYDDYDREDFAFSPDKRGPRNRVVFIPRIGKRALFIPRIGKRALFIPRIGRGFFVPQAVKYNPQFKISGRAVFIPRIG